MADFAVLTHRLTVEPHPDADMLECARIGGYFTVVRKDQFKTGDIAAVNGGVKVGRVGGRLLSIGDQILYRPPSFIGL